MLVYVLLVLLTLDNLLDGLVFPNVLQTSGLILIHEHVFQLVLIVALDYQHLEHNVLMYVHQIQIFMEILILIIVVQFVQIIIMLIQLIDCVKQVVCHYFNIILDV